MSDIELACHLEPWGHQEFVKALADISTAGFRGVEMTAEVVELYQDRVTVFSEILSDHRLRLIGITSGGAMWPGMNLDEEVERNLNVAKFLRAAGARYLTLYPPRPNPAHPIEDELDLVPAATAYGEIARRTLELDVETCLHPELGSCVDNPKVLGRFLHLADPEALHLCVDSAFLHLAGVAAPAFMKEHQKRLGLMHLRDVKQRENRKPRSIRRLKDALPVQLVELGQGKVDLKGFVKALLDVDYLGWATVEFEPSGSRSTLQAAQVCHRYAEQELDLVL